MENKKVFLIGFMGSGKTTVGQLLAPKMGFGFVDLDKLVEEFEGKSIQEIFKTNGESYFRELEKKVLLNLISNPGNWIISTGGGTPCFDNLIEFMNENGITIYLECSETILLERLQNNQSSRPLLNEVILKDFINQKMKERISIYHKAKITVDASEKEEIVSEKILIELNKLS